MPAVGKDSSKKSFQEVLSNPVVSHIFTAALVPYYLYRLSVVMF